MYTSQIKVNNTITEKTRDYLLLKLRDAIADKEWVIACANMETARNGEWTCDWNAGMREESQRIDSIKKQIDSL